MYDNEAATPHKVDITTTVTSDEGKVVFKTDEERVVGGLARASAAGTVTRRGFR